MDKLILNAKPLLGFDKDYRVTENGDIISMDYSAPEDKRN